MTVRVAVTGRAATPPLFETLAVLGKEICRRRLRRAAEALRAAKAPRRGKEPPHERATGSPATSSARSWPRTCRAAATRRS